MGFDLSTNTSNGTVLYQRALNLLKDKKQILISDIYLPGVTAKKHKYVVNILENVLNQRGDAQGYIDSAVLTQQPHQASENVQDINTSYLSAYFN